MGEASKRKEDDPNYGKLPRIKPVHLIKQTAMKKRLTEDVLVCRSMVEAVYIYVSSHPRLANRGFCHIKTHESEITLWQNSPFTQTKLPLDGQEFRSREWSGTFTTEIVDGEPIAVSRKFSMKSLANLKVRDFGSAILSGAAIDEFSIEGLLSARTSHDLPPEEILVQVQF
jgi:hypothetical protein